jgi:hypothetical protein
MHRPRKGAGCDTLENGGYQAVVWCTAGRRQMGEAPVLQLLLLCTV